MAGLLSIGALAEATGIPVDTIRTWERRYGFPRAERKPSGHRVYALATVPRLRRIAQALARGHRAAEVVPAPERALEALLEALPPIPVPAARPIPDAPRTPKDLVAAVHAFDAERLKRAFQVDWAGLGPLDFLEDRAAPLMRGVGDAWSKGSLDVRHEHFASAVLGDFLRAVRQPLDDRAQGPVAALATLPAEPHGLGLQMAAVVFALSGWRSLILGVDTPIEQIAALVREAPIVAVAISCVQARGRSGAGMLRTLRRRIPRHIPVIVGGAGAPRAARQVRVEVMTDLRTLDRWLHAHRAGLNPS